MLKIICGNDRIRANAEIKRTLGEDYEIIEGANLELNDLPTLFLGTSLFAEKRKILIRDLSANKPALEKLPDYLDTPHDVIVFELSLDKRTTTYKDLKAKVEIKEFTLPKVNNYTAVVGVYRTAKHDGKKSIEMLEKLKPSEEPMMFFGALASEAIKDYSLSQGTKEKRVLKELSALDLNLKSTSIDPWLLIESFLLRLRTI